jgi:hypothetical protein
MKKRGTVCRYACVAKVGGDKVAEAELTAKLSFDYGED